VENGEMTGNTAQSEKKFGGIELLRFLCAVAVIVHHYRFYFVSGSSTAQYLAPIESFPLYFILAPIYWKAQGAVLLFWSISGFIFFWKYADSIHGKTVGKSKFFVFRFSRLYPLHLLTLVIVLGLQSLYLRDHSENFIYPAHEVRTFLLQLVMASNWNSTYAETFNGPIWSVSVEALIYALFFLTVRTFRPGAVLCLVTILVASFILRSPFRNILYTVSVCAIYFFGGGLTRYGISHIRPEHRRIAFWIAAATSVTIAATMFPRGLSDFDVPPQFMLLSFALIASVALMDEVFRIDWTRAAQLGDLTYGSYLWHFPLQLIAVLIVDRIGLGRKIFLSPWPLLIWLVATFALAAASHRFFETPAQNAIRRLFLPRIFVKTAEPAQT
jgi:peptidoglycan/LPS O-acetylase OafA/YrhL